MKNKQEQFKQESPKDMAIKYRVPFKKNPTHTDLVKTKEKIQKEENIKISTLKFDDIDTPRLEDFAVNNGILKKINNDEFEILTECDLHECEKNLIIARLLFVGIVLRYSLREGDVVRDKKNGDEYVDSYTQFIEKKRVDDFALELLMPEKEFKEFFAIKNGQSIEMLQIEMKLMRQASDWFGVSVPTIIDRLLSVGGKY